MIKSKLGCIWAGALLALFALATVGSAGCAVNAHGVMLPNPHYFNSVPQYFPRGTEFPFPNEVANLQESERSFQR